MNFFNDQCFQTQPYPLKRKRIELQLDGTTLPIDFCRRDTYYEALEHRLSTKLVLST